jgi:hypothetical protein
VGYFEHSNVPSDCHEISQVAEQLFASQKGIVPCSRFISQKLMNAENDLQELEPRDGGKRQQ